MMQNGPQHNMNFKVGDLVHGRYPMDWKGWGIIIEAPPRKRFEDGFVKVHWMDANFNKSDSRINRRCLRRYALGKTNV